MSKITIGELARKTKEQINKELSRRGLPLAWYSKEEAIQAILEHDAYYEGVNDARRDCVKNGKPGCPQKIMGVYPPEPAPERELYCLVDSENPYDEPWIMRLTSEQSNFLRLLKDRGIVYESIEISKIPCGEIITP